MEYDENTILIFEGIHALQPQLRQGLASSNFGIYIHPNTSYVDQDGHTLLDARDLRLTRRIIRDNLHRGTPPLGTMQMWKDVLRGELLYMKPSSGTADVFVNTSHDYEPFLYAAVITGLLEQIEDAGENRETVERLLESYRHFFPIGTELVPQGLPHPGVHRRGRRMIPLPPGSAGGLLRPASPHPLQAAGRGPQGRLRRPRPGSAGAALWALPLHHPLPNSPTKKSSAGSPRSDGGIIFYSVTASPQKYSQTGHRPAHCKPRCRSSPSLWRPSPKASAPGALYC